VRAVPVLGVGAREGGDELDRRRTAEVRRGNEAEPGRRDLVDPALELMSSYNNRHMGPGRVFSRARLSRDRHSEGKVATHARHAGSPSRR
jgi:hypothetical protein